jgi:hypothetical protein
MLIHPTLPNKQRRYLCPDTFFRWQISYSTVSELLSPSSAVNTDKKPEKPGNRLPFQAPKRDFPLPVIHPYPPSGRTFSTPIIPHNNRRGMKNPENHLARFGAYPSSRIFPAVCVQNFRIIVIIDQALIGYLNLYNSSGSINRLSDVV